MTVESIARKAGPYEFTEGASYPFYFKIFEKTDVYVVVTDDTGVETTIEADTDYRVVMNENQDSDAGGYVTLLKDYTGSKITISSQVPYDQGVNITNKGGFYPSTLNKAYDKLTILCQQLLEQVSRCIKVNISSGVSADEYKDELEGLVNQSVSSAASAAASAQQAATDSAQAVSDSATALSRSTTALTQSGTALIQSNTALENSVSAVNSIQPALEAAQQASSDAAEAVEKSNQALAETTAIDDKVEQAVNDAISGVTIPGLTPETIAVALGYTPYNAETNSKDFATTAEVAEAIAATGQVNADWNATSGKAQILNKPVLSAVATSGNYADLNGKPALAAVATSGSYNDLQNKPATMTGATAEAAGTSGFVPAPQAGDAEKVLTGNGEWKVLGKATTEQAGIVRPDGTSINVSDGVISVSPEVAENALGKGQNWVNVTTERVSNTVYTNTTGKPIFVSVSKASGGQWATIAAYVDDVLVGQAIGYYTTVQQQHISFVVPNGSTYKVVSDTGFFNWSELR